MGLSRDGDREDGKSNMDIRKLKLVSESLTKLALNGFLPIYTWTNRNDLYTNDQGDQK